MFQCREDIQDVEVSFWYDYRPIVCCGSVRFWHDGEEHTIVPTPWTENLIYLRYMLNQQIIDLYSGKIDIKKGR